MKRINFRVVLGMSFFIGSVIFIALSRHYRELAGISRDEASWAFFMNIGTELFGAAVIFFMLEVVLRKREEEAEKADAKSDRIMMSLY
ncbi:MAG: hypothetical protein H7175_01765, partial [Burkholderiales bacterium]|nr:hypothetical protein [Anaerolineae bacterium]